MKTLASTAKKALVAIVAAALFSPVFYSCSDKGSDAKKPEAPAKTEAKADAPVNFRFIDGDSVSARYNLAKDFQQQYLRTVSRMQQAEQSKAAEIQRFGQQIEQKMRNNGYLTEESYNSDMMRLNKMQQDAQSYLANLQRNAEQELARQQQELNDSIEAFIKSYNKEKGYDAIFFKAAGVYFNPSLDITDEVVEGLNVRYKKASESK